MNDGTGAAKITIIVDNEAAKGLHSEHGFSAWIEVAGLRLLFDTGQGPALEDNADEIGLALQTADILVLSHGHYDHSGGIPFFLARALTADVYAHPSATGPRYSLRNGAANSISMPAPARTALESHGLGIRWTTQAVELANYVGITGFIPRITDFETTGGPFYIDRDGIKPDPIADDLALWLRTACGLVVIVGCSHAGLVNTLRYAVQISGERRLHAVVGGFHLKEASEIRLARTVAELQELDPELIIPCHCTGAVAVERLRQSFGKRVVPGFAGAVFRLGGSDRGAALELAGGATRDS